MRTIELALTTMSVCALLGASTSAYARLGSDTNGSRASKVSAVKERLGSLVTRTSSAQKPTTPATKSAQRDTSAKSKTPGVLAQSKAKLASMTKRVSNRASLKGTLRGARSGLGDKLVFRGSAVAIAGTFSFIPTALLAEATNNPLPLLLSGTVMAAGGAAMAAGFAHSLMHDSY